MIQWRDLEVITKELEGEKPRVIFKVFHNPDELPIVQPVPSHKVESGRVYIGGFEGFDLKEDYSYKSRCEKLEKELQEKTELIWKLKHKISELYDI